MEFWASIDLRRKGGNDIIVLIPYPTSRDSKQQDKKESATIIHLGDKVRDNITGFEGVAVAKSTYLNGCVSVGVKSTKLHEGKPLNTEWIDEQQLEVLLIHPVSDEAVEVVESAESSGPQEIPPESSYSDIYPPSR